MSKSTFLLCLWLVASAMLRAQEPTAAPAKSPLQTQLESRIKTIHTELAAAMAALENTADTSRFSPELLDSIYAAQRVLENISYSTYSRTTFPPVAIDTSDVYDDGPTTDEPPSDYPTGEPPRSGWGMFKKPKSPRTILRIGYSFGTTQMAEFGDRVADRAYPVFDANKSGFWSWQFIFETRLGKRDTTNMFPGGFNPRKPWKRDDQFKNTRLSLRTGLTIDRNRAREIGSHELLTLPNGQAQFLPFTPTARDNDFVIWNVSLPVVMQMKIGKGLIAQAGVFGSLRTNARQTITYGEGKYEYERDLRDDFGLAKFNYGLVAGLGLDGLYFTGRFCLNPFFSENDVYDYRMFSYGLTLSL